jgi:hypothetical protein
MEITPEPILKQIILFEFLPTDPLQIHLAQIIVQRVTFLSRLETFLDVRVQDPHQIDMGHYNNFGRDLGDRCELQFVIC